MAKIRQVKITNYQTHKSEIKEFNEEQFSKLKTERARLQLPIRIEVLKERDI